MDVAAGCERSALVSCSKKLEAQNTYRRNGDGGGLRRRASGHGGSKDSEGHDDREATRDAREHCE